MIKKNLDSIQKNNWIKRDLSTIWHPCSQMSDYKNFSPLIIRKAKKSLLYLNNGQKVIDANSSWWCKSLGHGHPLIKKNIKKQLQSYEHVISANIVQKPLVKLSETLLDLNPNFSKIFYASDGSTAIEIALKMAIHAQQRKGKPEKTHFIALENGYHGETTLTLSISHLELYKKPYLSLMPNSVYFLHDLPYVQNIEDTIEIDIIWKKILPQLEAQKEKTAAIIIEPIVQGTGGMKIYSPKILDLISVWAKKEGVYIILDEIMTGFFRTGNWFAYQYSKIEADFLCLSKGLTGGTLPLSATLISQAVYDLFYGEFGVETSFLHSNTFSGNALGASVANQVIEIYKKENIKETVSINSKYMKMLFEQMANSCQRIENIRHIGMLVAGDLVLTKEQEKKRISLEIFKVATQKGALLRPLGKTIYWLPPLNIERKILTRLAEITSKSIQEVLN